MKNPRQHTIETAQTSLRSKGLDFITIISIDAERSTVTLLDKEFGEYSTDVKCLTPKSTVTLHVKRRHFMKSAAAKAKFTGQTINGMTILDVFHGPERGYKNKSFYLEYEGSCGHRMISTFIGLTKHKKSFGCIHCKPALHGERIRLEGVLKKRSPTYIYWVSKKKTLPERLHNYQDFLAEVGEKPYPKATLVESDAKLLWSPIAVVDDVETNLIASAIRQAFRHSGIYKKAIADSRVETEEGPRYICATCLQLAKRKAIQVDHINPVAPIDGSPVDRNTLIDVIWTTEIQVLDRACHAKKSATENKIRRENKKKLRGSK